MTDVDAFIAETTVSVIVPCFNSEKYVFEAINSALVQHGGVIEIIIVDDGSTDATAEVLEQFAGKVRVIHQRNSGAAAARNRGIAASSGSWIKFLDADDILLPGALSGQLAEIHAADSKTFPVGRSFRLSEDYGTLVPHASHDGTDIRVADIGQLLFDCPLISAPMYPRHALVEIGGFDEQLTYREDCDLFVRLVLAGWTPCLTTTPVFIYRDHGTQGRVSKQDDANSATSQQRMFGRWAEILDSYGGMAEPILRRALSRAAWVAGRNVLRSGRIELAESLFQVSRELDPGAGSVGRLPYRWLVGLLGARKVEALLEKIKVALPLL